MLKKTDKPNVFKDTKTGALINRDFNRLNSYKKQKEILKGAKESKEELEDMRSTVSELKSEVSHLLKTMEKISEKIGKE